MQFLHFCGNCVETCNYVECKQCLYALTVQKAFMHIPSIKGPSHCNRLKSDGIFDHFLNEITQRILLKFLTFETKEKA